MVKEEKLTVRNTKDGRVQAVDKVVALNRIKYEEWELIGSEAEEYSQEIIIPKKKEVVNEVVEAAVVEEVFEEAVAEEKVEDRTVLDAKHKALYGKAPSPKWSDEAVIKRIKKKENE